MKKLLLFVALLVVANLSQAQLSFHPTKENITGNKLYIKAPRNSIEFNAAPLLGQFFNLTGAFIFNQYNDYYITYRRHLFRQDAVRLRAGGFADNSNTVQNDTLHQENNSTNYRFSLGYEHSIFVAKKWSMFFGADIFYGSYRTSFSYEYNDSVSTSNYTKSNSFGVSPFAGVAFNINARMSLSTETHYDVANSSIGNGSTYINGSTIYTSKSEGTEFTTRFIPPVSLNFRVRF